MNIKTIQKRTGHSVIEMKCSYIGVYMLPELKKNFEADGYCHVGDRDDLDRKYALRAGFEFMWPDEAAEKDWFSSDL